MLRLWEVMQAAHLTYEPRYYALAERSRYLDAAARYIDGLVRDPDAICIVCADAGNLWGSLVAKVEKKPPVYTDVSVASIDHVCVDEAHRGKGVFRRMYALLESTASKRSVDSIECYVDCDNSALAAYRAIGMVPRQMRMVKHIQKDAAPGATSSDSMLPDPQSSSAVRRE